MGSCVESCPRDDFYDCVIISKVIVISIWNVEEKMSCAGFRSFIGYVLVCSSGKSRHHRKVVADVSRQNVVVSRALSSDGITFTFLGTP